MIVYGCRPFNYGDDHFVRAMCNGLVISHKSLVEVNGLTIYIFYYTIFIQENKFQYRIPQLIVSLLDKYRDEIKEVKAVSFQQDGGESPDGKMHYECLLRLVNLSNHFLI